MLGRPSRETEFFPARKLVTRAGHGFIETGRDADGQVLSASFGTSKPGIFAVGDVRSGSIKRVASAAGEGSVVVQAIHQSLDPGAT